MTAWRARTALTPSAAPCSPRPSLLEMTCPPCATSCTNCVSRHDQHHQVGHAHNHPRQTLRQVQRAVSWQVLRRGLATGRLTVEQAAKKFTFISDETRRPAAAAAVLKRYQGHQAHTGGSNPKSDELEPMCTMTKAVPCYNVDLRPANSPGFEQDDGHVVLHMDSKFDHAHVQRHALISVWHYLRAQCGGQDR
eukprot:5407641-Pleurochrysis_carterae.AAC.2